MRLDIPSQMLPPGALVDAANYIVGTNGLKRRPAFDAFTAGAVGYQPVVDMIPVWANQASQTTLIVDDKFIYTSTNQALIGVYSTYVGPGPTDTTGTIEATASDETITGTNTLWDTAASDVKAGDVIILDADGSGNGPEELVIDSITNDTSLETVTAPANNHAAGSDYVIRRALDANDPYLVDYTIVGPTQNEGGSLDTETYIILSDYARSPFAYAVGAGTYAAFLADDTERIPATVEFFGQRLWMGNIIEGNSVFQHRVQWTSPLDRTRFDLTEPQTGYEDLRNVQGGIRKLKRMGSLLIAYFDDGILFGRLTNSTTRPVAWDQVETGGIGLVGVKAVTNWLGGHFFIGQDDVYYLGSRGGQPERIGTPIVKKSIREAESLSRSYAIADPKNDRVCFGFQKTGNDMEEIYSFNYKSKSWSYDEISTTMLSDEGIVQSITWDTLSSFIGTDDWDAGMVDFASWDAITDASPGVKTLFYAQNGIVYRLKDDGGSDAVGGTISATFETGDMDLDLPDRNKMFNRISVKIDEAPTSDIVFTVTGSTNRGLSYKSLGTLTIPSGSDEGRLNFRMTGSNGRFRLVEATDVDPFTITELVVRARPGGLETD